MAPLSLTDRGFLPLVGTQDPALRLTPGVTLSPSVSPSLPLSLSLLPNHTARVSGTWFFDCKHDLHNVSTWTECLVSSADVASRSPFGVYTRHV